MYMCPSRSLYERYKCADPSMGTEKVIHVVCTDQSRCSSDVVPCSCSNRWNGVIWRRR